MITLAAYWMGRDTQYKADLTDEIMANATALLPKVNKLLDFADDDGIDVGPVASGWRPPAVNAGTKNAAPKSKHMTGHAVDLRDDKYQSFARWCTKNIDLLVECGLWMEHPGWTPTWVHLQDLPPGSGKRIFIPSSKPALNPEFTL
jgi:hypothetical protein